MRVFNNPNHPAYGPVRRVWVMLAGLDLLGDVTDNAYLAMFGVRWDECMSDAIILKKATETQLARVIVGRMIRMAR